MGSGFQKFILDVIMRIVLTNISTVSNSNLIFIDEGFGCLDKENFIEVANILKKLKNNFSAMIVITHIPELKSYADKNIIIKKNLQDSMIEYGEKNDYNYDYDNENKISTPPNTTISNNKMTLIELRGTFYYCKACRVEKKYTESAVKKHLESKTYKVKHDNYCLNPL